MAASDSTSQRKMSTVWWKGRKDGQQGSISRRSHTAHCRSTRIVRNFGGSNRHVVDFLVSEVLDAHTPLEQALMLHTSILERLTGPLCDAVMNQEGSAEMLDGLLKSNLFLVPLDDEAGSYRFHHVFAQLLRVELERREPGQPRICTVAPTPGIVTTVQLTRRSSMPSRPRLSPKQSSSSKPSGSGTPTRGGTTRS